jgi:hypothetical protein
MSLPEGPFIFVSYSRRDSYFVHPEIERLERRGYKVWYDKGQLQPGLLWDEQIRRAVRASNCFVVFVSENAVNSERVCDEMDQALEANKPFVCVFLEKVELPPRFQEPILSMQTLERYALRRHEYEEPLDRALSEYTGKTRHTPGEEGARAERAAVLPQSQPRPDALPLIVFFGLLLAAGASLFLACVVPLVPYVGFGRPGDPLNSPLAGFMTGLFFAAVAASLGAGAYAVYRVYLRRKNG